MNAISNEFLARDEPAGRARTARQFLQRAAVSCRRQLVEITPTRPSANAPGRHGPKIPGGEFDFDVSGIEIEGYNEVGVDVQYPWEDSPRRGTISRCTIKPFYMDKYPVTNEEFKKFIDASHYHPEDDHNFLRDWKNGSYPGGLGE